MNKRRLLPIVALLLIHFFLRSHQITSQYAYVDEGFHIQRGAFAWDFDMNPGRFAHGKLLLYYWLGLFETDTLHALPMARLGMALISLLTAAALYLMGRLLRDHQTGLLALAVYAFLPYAFFFERMALADPFAAVFAALVAWRSLVFARRPSVLQGVIVGLLLAAVTLAKLSMGLMPGLPAVAALIYHDWRPLRPQTVAFVRRYAPPLIIAWVTLGLAWSPILIPAYLARNSDEPFTIVDDSNTGGQQTGWLRTPIPYLEDAFRLASDYTTKEFLIVAGLAVVLGLLLGKSGRHTLFLLAWFLATITLTIAAAGWMTSRYLMPAASVGVLALVFCMVTLADRIGSEARLVVVTLAGVWLVAFAIPFFRNAVTDPQALPLHGTNEIEYLAGSLIADDPEWAVAEAVTDLSPERVYATWLVCRMVFFYTDARLTCLGRSDARSNLADLLDQQMPDCESSYVINGGYPEAVLEIRGLSGEKVDEFYHKRIRRTVQLWRVWWTERCNTD